MQEGAGDVCVTGRLVYVCDLYVGLGLTGHTCVVQTTLFCTVVHHGMQQSVVFFFIHTRVYVQCALYPRSVVSSYCQCYECIQGIMTLQSTLLHSLGVYVCVIVG